MISRFRLFPIAALPLVGACAIAERAGEPRLVQVGMVVLEESETRQFTIPAGFALDPDGGYYIADARTGLVRFDPDGQFLGQYGQTGDGPGEYRWPTAPHVPDDSTVLVADMGRFSLTAYDRASGTFRERRELVEPILSLHHDGKGLLLGTIVPPMNFALQRLSAVTSPLEPITLLPWPATDQAAGMVNVALTVQNGDLFAGAGLSNDLVRLRGHQVVDTLGIPIVRRRGVPADLAGRLAATERARWMAIYSTQWLAVPLGDRLVIVHVDLDPLDEPVSPPRPQFTTTHWLTVLSDDETRACADIRIPTSPDLYPFLASRGDTLLVLDHHDTGSDIQMAVRKYLVDTIGCEWLPVRRGGGNN